MLRRRREEEEEEEDWEEEKSCFSSRFQDLSFFYSMNTSYNTFAFSIEDREINSCQFFFLHTDKH